MSLVDVSEEAEGALLEQRRRALLVVGEAVVGEQVAITRIQEQLGLFDRGVELAGGVEVALERPLVALHQVDLERNTGGPRAAELLGRNAAAEEQRSLRARPRLGEHLSRHRAERKTRVHQLVRQAFRGDPTAFENGVEADLPGVANAVLEVVESRPVVQIGSVHDVPRSAELIREREASRREPVRVMEEQTLGHVGGSLATPRPTGQTYSRTASRGRGTWFGSSASTSRRA